MRCLQFLFRKRALNVRLTVNRTTTSDSFLISDSQIDFLTRMRTDDNTFPVFSNVGKIYVVDSALVQ